MKSSSAVMMIHTMIVILLLAVSVQAKNDLPYTTTAATRRTEPLDGLFARLLQQQAVEQNRRQLPSLEDATGNSIGQSVGGRPTREPQEEDDPLPEEPSGNEITTPVTPAGPPRRAILPFVVSLSPVASSPTYQQQIATRNAVEESLDLFFKSKYSATVSDVRNTTIAMAPTTAIVTYVGLTQILDSQHSADVQTAQITLQGMVYFADGSVNVPSEQEIAAMITTEALSEESLVASLTELFPTVQSASAQSVAEEDEVVVATEAPIAPTEAPISPTEAPITPTDAPVQPTAAPVAPTNSPTAPVPAGSIQETLVGLRMGLIVTELPISSQQKWVELTTEFSQSHFMNDASVVQNFATAIEITNILPVDRRRILTDGQGRELQQNAIIVEYTQTMQYDSTDASVFPEVLATSPFETLASKNAYVTLLRASNDPVLQGVKDVSSVVLAPSPTESPTALTTQAQVATPPPTEAVATPPPTEGVTVATPAPSVGTNTDFVDTPSATPTAAETVWETTWWPETELPGTEWPATDAPVEVDGSPALEIPADDTTASPVFDTASIVGSENTANDDDSINLGVLIGCAVAGFIVIVLAAVVLVQIKKLRNADKNAEDRTSLAAFAKSDEDYSGNGNDDEQLVDVDIARLVNFDDDEVLSGFIHEGDSRGTASLSNYPATASPSKVDKSGETVEEVDEDLESGITDQPVLPRSPSEISGPRRRKSREAEAAKSIAQGASAMSYWSSLFGKSTSKKIKEEDALSDSDPPQLQSASVASGGAETDGTLSDFGDAETDIVSKSMESFQQHALKGQYIVKKDMLESSATMMAPVNMMRSTSEKNPGIELSPSQEIEASNSEMEEDRRANNKMMPNPYVRRSFNFAQPTVDRSGSCALTPTDMSAATLAKADDDENNDGDDVGTSQVNASSLHSRMVPRLTSPKSWWRKSKEKSIPLSSFEDKDNEDRDEDSTFGPSGSNGWDPNDTELGSMGTNPNEEDLFKPVVDSRTGQALVGSSRREHSTPTATEPSGYTSFNETGSVSSEENTSLKLDSAFAF
ncbi:MAG: hypothetical protein SGILL_003831 [Bacillariaceae sp.]